MPQEVPGGGAPSRVVQGGVEPPHSNPAALPEAGIKRAAPRRRRRLERVLAAAAALFVLWFYYWTVKANSGFDYWADMDYYQALVRGWTKGQLHLDVEPMPELLALADPYDPEHNTLYKLGDASLYRNRYYIYFGPAPAATLMLPYALLTGHHMTMGAATFVFASVAFLAASALWLGLRRRFFPESRGWTAPCGVLAIGFGTHLLAMAQRPMFWELAISSGIAFSLLAVFAAWRAMEGKRPLLSMAMAGLCVGLAVASRPTCLFASPLLLAPLWLAWRENRPWFRMAVAATVPLAACGLAIMAHNYARFENPLEWGQNYQLSGAYESKLRHFSLFFFPHNFATYFFHPLTWTSEFPFAKAVPAPACTVPGYFGTEEVSGLAATFPYLWFGLALPLAWRRRNPADARRLAAGLAAVGGYALPVMVLVLCYFSTTMRYEADFGVALAVIALVGLLGLERAAQASRWPWRAVVATVGVLAAGATVIVGVLVSLDYHGRSVQVTSPLRWRELSRSNHQRVASLGLKLGALEGPRVLKVRFTPKPPGTIETFWQAADARAAERITVEHIGERLIRFGYARGDEAVVWGRPLKWEQSHTHTVSVQVPSLYPRAGDGWWSAARRTQEFRERTGVAVWFSGGRALAAVVEPWPPDIVPGGTVGADFSGEVRGETHRLFREDELPFGLKDPHARRGGVLRMRVVFADRMGEKGEPIFAAGAHYRSSIVFAEPADGGVKIVFENYALPRVGSAVFRPNPRGHVLELEMASFRPEAFGLEATGDLIVRLDGREILRSRQIAYPFSWGDERLGWNPFGTTCESEFRGWIEAEWVQ